jgi:hypothetical protein
MCPRSISTLPDSAHPLPDFLADAARSHICFLILLLLLVLLLGADHPLYMCPHPLNMCPHTPMCPHNPTTPLICVLILPLLLGVDHPQEPAIRQRMLLTYAGVC